MLREVLRVLMVLTGLRVLVLTVLRGAKGALS